MCRVSPHPSGRGCLEHEKPSPGASVAEVDPMLSHWPALLVPVAFVAALCGCSVADAGNEEPSHDSDDLRRLASAICALRATCACEVFGDPKTASECEELHYEGLRQVGVNAADSDTYVFDGDCLRELADCWEQLECGQSWQDAQQCAPSCAVHQRNLSAGEPCVLEGPRVGLPSLRDECDDGFACLSSHGDLACDDPTPLQAGETCHREAGRRRCGDGLYCAGEPGEQRCVPLLGEGSASNPLNVCAGGLVCPDEICVPPAELGDDCETTEACGSGLTCHPVSGTCVGPVQLGEQCEFADEQWLQCAGEAFCGDEGCEPRLPPGSACGSAGSDACSFGSRCSRGVCFESDALCSAIPLWQGYPSGEP